MTKPRLQPNSNDTKTAILDAAEELIQTRGSNGISYASISDRVGIRKASIHHHFPTKEKLVEAVVRRYSTQFIEQVDAIAGSRKPAPAKLREYARLFDHTLQAPPGHRVCLCGMLGAELGSLSAPAASLLRRFYRDNEQRLASIMEAGRKEGTLQFVGDPRTMGMSLFSFLEGAMLVARADRGSKQFRRLSDGVLGLLSA